MISRIILQSVRHRRAERFFYLSAVLLLLSCRHTEPPIQIAGTAQGTYYSVQYCDKEHRNLQPQIDSLLDAFDQSVSLWVDSSLLRQINSGKTDSLDDILQSLLEKSLMIEQYTDGAFNCKVGRLVQSWGFSFSKRSIPDSLSLQTMLDAAHADVSIANHRLVRTNSSTELDFNAIAQGYASDLIAQMLERYGISDYLVDIGGEVVAHGKKPDGSLWRVGIEEPSKDSCSAPIVYSAIQLSDASVVTSGSYRKYYERDGLRFSHTIDPATGQPVQHTLLSVSVVEKECWLADAMATAYMVMGLENAKAFIASHPHGPGTDAVLFIYDRGGALESYATPGFDKLIIK